MGLIIRRLKALLAYPLYVVENLVQLVGPLFVAVVWTLISGIVWGWWAILRPYLWEKDHITALCHGIFAHWLLLNIVFHYYKGTTLHPGEPPQVSPETYERGVELNYKHCTRCKNLKPERAHHCIICKTCVLNMDHHCPWLNTCVGHFNHRHFFLFMWYIWLGCVYVASVSHGPFMARKNIRAQLRRENRMGEYKMELARQGIPEQSSQLSFCFVLTCAVTFALGILIIWHIYLISTSQTTIEFYSNALKRRRAREHGETWKNPYHLGFKYNWYSFLGVEEGNWKSWLRVLFPSQHLPDGDGLHWSHLTRGSKFAPRRKEVVA
eukprot:m.378916 g.378916  ORF g.378916 m.378916 type:complete len:323 (-) comp20941_c1_seq3:1098-2066(-)